MTLCRNDGDPELTYSVDRSLPFFEGHDEHTRLKRPREIRWIGEGDGDSQCKDTDKVTWQQETRVIFVLGQPSTKTSVEEKQQQA